MIDAALGEKLNLILKKAGLPEKFELLWQTAFKCLNKEEMVFLTFALEKFSADEILEISSILEKKVEAIAKGNLNLWEEILAQEAVFFQKYKHA